MSQITTGVLYNARGSCQNADVGNVRLTSLVATWDLRQTVEWVRENWPKRKLFGLGFSLGANILTNVCRLSGPVRPCLEFFHESRT